MKDADKIAEMLVEKYKTASGCEWVTKKTTGQPLCFSGETLKYPKKRRPDKDQVRLDGSKNSVAGKDQGRLNLKRPKQAKPDTSFDFGGQHQKKVAEARKKYWKPKSQLDKDIAETIGKNTYDDVSAFKEVLDSMVEAEAEKVKGHNDRYRMVANLIGGAKARGFSAAGKTLDLGESRKGEMATDSVIRNLPSGFLTPGHEERELSELLSAGTKKPRTRSELIGEAAEMWNQWSNTPKPTKPKKEPVAVGAFGDDAFSASFRDFYIEKYQLSEAQKEAGNYKKRKIQIQGLPISIENEVGSIRSGKGWETKMKNAYGYIRGYKSIDGDQVDVFIGPNEKSEIVYVVDQVNKDGSFDEHKVMIGFNTLREAKEAYLSNYSKGWKCGNITPMTVTQFKTVLPRFAKKKAADMIKFDARELETERFSVEKKPNVFLNVAGVNLIQNPTRSDEMQMRKEVRREFPNLAGNDERIRYTHDRHGNRWIWKAHEAVHGNVETELESIIGDKVRYEWDEKLHPRDDGGRFASIDPNKVETLNGIEDSEKYKKLVDSMRQGGWQGRPVAVAGGHRGSEFDGLTGSHRTIAARDAGIDIPAIELDANELAEIEVDGEDLLTVLTQSPYDDEDKLNILKSALSEHPQLQQLHDLFEQEVDSNLDEFSVPEPQPKRDAQNALFGKGKFIPKKYDEDDKKELGVETKKVVESQNDLFDVGRKEPEKKAKPKAGNLPGQKSLFSMYYDDLVVRIRNGISNDDWTIEKYAKQLGLFGDSSKDTGATKSQSRLFDTFTGQAKAKSKPASPPKKKKEDGRWVTIHGTHVFIDGKGTIKKGPDHFVGKKPSEIDKDTKYKLPAKKEAKPEEPKKPSLEEQKAKLFETAKRFNSNAMNPEIAAKFRVDDFFNMHKNVENPESLLELIQWEIEDLEKGITEKEQTAKTPAPANKESPSESYNKAKEAAKEKQKMKRQITAEIEKRDDEIRKFAGGSTSDQEYIKSSLERGKTDQEPHQMSAKEWANHYGGVTEEQVRNQPDDGTRAGDAAKEYKDWMTKAKQRGRDIHADGKADADASPKTGWETDGKPTVGEIKAAVDGVRKTAGKNWVFNDDKHPGIWKTKYEAVAAKLRERRAIAAKEKGLEAGDWPSWNGNFRDIATEKQIRDWFPEKEVPKVLKDPISMTDLIDKINKKNEPEGGWKDEHKVPIASQRATGPKEGDRDENGLVFRNGRWHRDDATEKRASQSGQVGKETAQKAPTSFDSEKHGGYKQLMQVSNDIDEGKLTAEEFKSQHEFWAANKQEHIAALQKQFNATKLKNIASHFDPYNYKTNTKEKNAKAIQEGLMRQAFHIGDGMFSYSHDFGSDKDSFADAIKSGVEKVTDDDLKAYADRRAKSREEYEDAKKAKEKAESNPETLSDFKTYVRKHGKDKLTREQVETMDRLSAEKTRGERQTIEDQRKTVSAIDTTSETPGEFSLSKNYHSKRETDIFTASPENRVDKDKYREMNAKAKQLGGWYYKAFRGTPGGFHFPDEESRGKFLKLFGGEDVDNSEKVEARAAEKAGKTTSKLTELADRIEARATEQLNSDRKTNTARRAGMAAHAEARAQGEIAKAKTLRNISEAIDSGDAKHLAKVSNGTHVDALDSALRMASWDHIRKEHKDKSYSEQEEIRLNGNPADHIHNAEYPHPYFHASDLHKAAEAMKGKRGVKYDRQTLINAADALNAKSDGHGAIRNRDVQQSVQAAIDKLKTYRDPNSRQIVERLKDAGARQNRLKSMGIHDEHELREALREYVPIKGNEAKADPVKTAERKLIGKKLPGFFPTPPSVIESALEKAGIQDGHEVLEPSAGAGHIMDAIRANHPEAKLKGLEMNRTLDEVLGAKDHNVEFGDFKEHRGKYDRIVMNPPFERNQDAEHVKHAFDQLKPGGRVVAIVSGGGGAKRAEFDKWIELHGGTVEDLPAGSFAGSDAFRQTGVNSRIVTIDKGASKNKFQWNRPEIQRERFSISDYYDQCLKTARQNARISRN